MTGTLTQDYMMKITYDKDAKINIDSHNHKENNEASGRTGKKRVDYYADDSSEEMEADQIENESDDMR